MISTKILVVLFLSIIFSFSGLCQTKKIFKLPAGPEEPGRFGAYYTHLNYDPEWDKNWRFGKYSDVVVRFDDRACGNTGQNVLFYSGSLDILHGITSM